MHIGIDTEAHAQSLSHWSPSCCRDNGLKHMVSLVLTCHLSAGNIHFTEHTHTHTHPLVRLWGGLSWHLQLTDVPQVKLTHNHGHIYCQCVLSKTVSHRLSFCWNKVWFHVLSPLCFICWLPCCVFYQINSAAIGPLGMATNSQHCCFSGTLFIKNLLTLKGHHIGNLHSVPASWLLMENGGISP